MGTVWKTFVATTKVLSEADGLVRFVASAPTKDRDDEMVLHTAWKDRLGTYLSHPVLVANHDYKSLCSNIGKVVSLDVAGGKLVGVAQYFINEGNAEADWGFKLAQHGIAAYSVGFLPHGFDVGRTKGDPKITYTDVELLEISQVIIPSNRDSLQTASIKSIAILGPDKITNMILDDLGISEKHGSDANNHFAIEHEVVAVDAGVSQEKYVEITTEKCVELAPQWYARRAPQEVAEYDPLGGTDVEACANCLFFMSPNKCTVVVDWPVAISPTGRSMYWTAIPADKPMEVVVVGVGATASDPVMMGQDNAIDKGEEVEEYTKGTSTTTSSVDTKTVFIDGGTTGDGMATKAGQRNSRADMERMGRLRDRLEQCMTELKELMGEEDEKKHFDPEAGTEEHDSIITDGLVEAEDTLDSDPVSEGYTIEDILVELNLDLAAIRRQALSQVVDRLTEGAVKE